MVTVVNGVGFSVVTLTSPEGGGGLGMLFTRAEIPESKGDSFCLRLVEDDMDDPTINDFCSGNGRRIKPLIASLGNRTKNSNNKRVSSVTFIVSFMSER